jgi:hypothetical protein
VNGRDFLIRGVNWDYFPIGTNYTYSLWTQPSDVIAAALDHEMGLLRAMGVNVIRVYNGIPARWIQYIHDRFGIYTVVNHALGRYGNSASGSFVAQTDYSDPRTRAALSAEVLAIVDELKGTPGLLMYLLGNENNYGLEWRSAATENLPVGERQAAKAKFLYSLVGEVARAIKAKDPTIPVALANGDIQYLDIIAQEARGLDVFGSNVYRGVSFGSLFQEVKDKLGLPVMFTEFGADAWNEKEGREDQLSQSRYLLSQWREIYEQTSGKGRVGNAIGGMTFQWSDGWWKYGQETRLDIHDANASWAAEAYQYDFVRGENNMNEEWWGLAAKGPPDARGLYELYPRAAFYGLQKAYALDPYAPDTDLARIASTFGAIDLSSIVMQARADQAAAAGSAGERLRVNGMRLELSTFNTGGERLSTPRATSAESNRRPSARGFDRLESFFVGVEARPNERFQANLSVNILGNVPDNPIDEIFYENRGRARSVTGPAGVFGVSDLERLKVFQSSFSWDERLFRLEGFNRTGHYHWGYEGDFFGVYREANYGRNIDIYNAAAPLGMEFTGKRQLSGLKVAFGPELWWGANPAALVKYGRKVGDITVTGLYHEEIASYGQTTSSFAIPLPQTRRATLHAATSRLLFGGTLGMEAGAIWGGATRVGQKFQVAEGSPGSYRVLLDEVRNSDTFGGKARLTFQRGRWNWYAQGASMGIVADGGPTSVQTFTGWGLKDTGLSNQVNALTGVAVAFGSLTVAPNFLWQKPLVGPVPRDVPAPGRPRNVIDDPFAVRGQRETVAGELLLTWDPTPATWMYQWDNDLREDATLAASVGFTFRHLPTTMDAAIGILGDGRTTFAFPGATPARDLWELRGRVITRLGADTRAIVNFFHGTAEPNGDSQRLVRRSGGDVRLVTGHVKVVGSARYNDFGPYDYHRDFNLTFPAQYMLDLSYVLGKPQWWDVPETKFGIRGTSRSLDRYSPRYCPVQVPDSEGNPVCDGTAPGYSKGREWEIRSYLTVAW